MHERVIARAALDEINECDLIDHRVGIGHHHDGRDPARGRSKACGFERFTVFSARLPREHLAINESRRQDMALAINDFGASRRIAAQMGAKIGDHAIFDQQTAWTIKAGRWVQQAGVDEGCAPARSGRAPFSVTRGLVGGPGGFLDHRLGRLRASASRTAMRTATPISTCSRMTLRE